jgi:methylated-DNA-protein-cysteine methyltransferase related protein
MVPEQLTFSQKVKELIRSIPKGKVATYGQIAAYAGNPLGAKQVAYVLHSSSKKDKLPWHRVINSKGKISLPIGNGYETQKRHLRREKISFDNNDVIDLDSHLWNPMRVIQARRKKQ